MISETANFGQRFQETIGEMIHTFLNLEDLAPLQCGFVYERLHLFFTN
jgi:hypothetical protein